MRACFSAAPRSLYRLHKSNVLGALGSNKTSKSKMASALTHAHFSAKQLSQLLLDINSMLDQPNFLALQNNAVLVRWPNIIGNLIKFSLVSKSLKVFILGTLTMWNIVARFLIDIIYCTTK